MQQGLGYHFSIRFAWKEVAMRDIEVLIRERAYLIWEKSGKPTGLDRDHWFQAAREIDEAMVKDPLAVTAVEMMPPSDDDKPAPKPKAAAMKRMPLKLKKK
jgi:hypothetical protein